MKKRSLPILCTALAMALASCKGAGSVGISDSSIGAADTDSSAPGFNYSCADTSQNASQLPDRLDAELNSFDRSLAEYLYSNGHYSSSFAVSPAAFRASLCLAAHGAQGSTLDELIKVLGFSDNAQLELWQSLFQRGVSRCIAELDEKQKAADSPLFRLAASVWSSREQLGEFELSYKAYVEDRAGAEAYVCADDELSESLDSWFSEKTEGAVMKPGKDVTGAASVIASTVYLDSMWLEGVQTAVREDIFTDKNGLQSRVRFIELTGEFLCHDENGTQIVELPLEGNMSLVIVCGDRAEMFERLSELKKESVRVMLPEFEISSLFSADDLLNYLISRGAGNALISMGADFGSICKDGRWFMQEMLQAVKLSVRAVGEVETPNKAEAATKEFKADSPFTFAVFSDMGEENGQLLLYGQLMTVSSQT